MRANHCVYYQSPAVNLERVDLGLLPPIGGLLPHLGRHEVLGPADGLHGLQDGLAGRPRSLSFKTGFGSSLEDSRTFSGLRSRWQVEVGDISAH